MKRTTASGHDNNLYTEGNPAGGVPATVLGADEMNHIQEEIAEAIEGAGITLSDSSYTQLFEAIKTLIGVGGAKTDFTIVDNQTSAADVTGLSFDSSNETGAKVFYRLKRRDDTQNSYEIGTLWLVYDADDTTWRLSMDSRFDDAGVSFSVTTAGQVQYTSSSYGGANYAGTLELTGIVRFSA